jgi:hypothetical protein
VLLSERRLDRTAFEREISDICAILAMGPSRPLAASVNSGSLKGR